MFWSIKTLNEVLNKLKSRSFRVTSLSTYDFFFTIYTSLPHNLIKEKLNDLIKWTINREGSLYFACNGINLKKDCLWKQRIHYGLKMEEMLFSLPKSIEIIPYDHVRKCVKLSLFYMTICKIWY